MLTPTAALDVLKIFGLSTREDPMFIYGRENYYVFRCHTTKTYEVVRIYSKYSRANTIAKPFSYKIYHLTSLVMYRCYNTIIIDHISPKQLDTRI